MPVAKRGLITQTIKRFKGINRFRTATQEGPEWAIDLSNVIVHRHGGVEKLRVPVAISNVLGGLTTGPSSFFDYQRADGTRQVIAMEGTRIYRFAGTPLVGVEIDNNAGNAGTWSAVQSNNLLFIANGTRMLKWDGTNLTGWGIAKPSGSLTLGRSPTIRSPASPGLDRVANVVTVDMAAGGLPFIVVGSTVVISGADDTSFNGTQTVASVVSNNVFTYNQTGPNASSGNGTATFESVENNSIIIETPASTGAVRTSNVVRIIVTSGGGIVNFEVGQEVVVTGVDDPGFNGTHIVASVGPTSFEFTYNQVGPDKTSGNGAAVGNFSGLGTGVRYRVAGRNSVTGHVGPPSDRSPLATSPTGATPLSLFVDASGLALDAQVDTLAWYRTIDGGGDFFAHSEEASSDTELVDTFVDGRLTKGTRVQFLNEPPPVGFFLTKSAGRIFVLRLAAARHDIAYTGYERILDGRPEESFPPSNRLRLAIGADEIRGGGVIQAGIIAFSKSNEMFMYRGIPEDVTTDEPIAFAAILEQLPWDIGSASGHAIKSTPYGLAWYGADNKVYVYNGEGEPIDMSEGIYPLLRQVTASARANSRAAFFRWLESDWYALLVPVNGSTVLNRIFLFDMTNDESNVGVLVLDIRADSIGIIETADGDRRLVIGVDGLLKELAVGSYTDLGITTTPSGTSDTLAAWYRTGYFGNETPQAMKMWRFINTVVDQGGFRQDLYFVDRNNTLSDPLIVTGKEVINEQVVANQKAKRMSVLTNFPSDDVTAAILEMSVSHIPVSER